MQNFPFLPDLLKEETLLVFVSFCAFPWIGIVFPIIVFVFFWTYIFCVVASHCRPWIVFMANYHIIRHQAIFSLFNVCFLFYNLYTSFKTERFSRTSAFAHFHSWSLRKQLSRVQCGLIWVFGTLFLPCSRHWYVVLVPIFVLCKLFLRVWNLVWKRYHLLKACHPSWKFLPTSYTEKLQPACM